MNTDSTAMQQEIEVLQVKLAYQEDTIEQLNQIVTTHQGQIRALEKLTGSIIEKFKGMQSQESAINDGVELPPHY